MRTCSRPFVLHKVSELVYIYFFYLRWSGFAFFVFLFFFLVFFFFQGVFLVRLLTLSFVSLYSFLSSVRRLFGDNRQ